MTRKQLSLSVATAALVSFSPALAQTDTAASDDKIIVTAAPYAQSEQEILTGVSVLDGAELSRNVANSIGETLRKEPGVSTTFFGAGASRPIVRGQGGDRVRVLDNGIGSIDASSASPDHAVAVEPALAERIEILRGVSILRYGSSGAGGVVNVIDGRLPSEAPEEGLEGAFRIGTTTVDEGVDLAAGVTATLGEVNGMEVVGHLSGTWRDADDYDIPGFAESERLRALEEEEHEDHDEDEDHDHEEEEEIRDTLENSFVESSSYAGGLSFIGDKGFISFGVKQSNTEYGVPAGHDHGHHEEEEEDHDEEEHEEEGGVFIDLDQTRYDVRGGFDLGSTAFDSVSFSIGFADYEHIEFEGPGEPGTVFSNEGYEGRVELLQTERNGWRGATGLQLRHRDFSAIGEEAFVSPSETKQYAIYTFQEIDNGPWHFEGALRYENTEQTNDTLNIEQSFDGVSVSAGAAYHFSDEVLTGLTIYRTERAPTTEELFSDGPHLATGQYEIGDPDLDLEVATGIEGVFRVGSERASLAVNVFYTDYQDYIYEADTGLTGEDILIAEGVTDEEELEEFGELGAYQFTAEDATFYGFEIEGRVVLADEGPFKLSLDAVVDRVEAEIDVDGNDNLPRIPPLGITSGVDFEMDNLFLRGEVEFAGEQGRTTDFELPTDSYTLVNFYADVTPFPAYPNVSLSAAALNVTDEEARVHSSFLKDEIPLPGRNYRFAVKYSF